MQKGRKILIFALSAILLLGGLWVYWEWPMTLDTLIPEETWVRAELRYGVAGDVHSDVEFEEPALDRILPKLKTVRLTRAEKRHFVDDRYFQIILYKGESYPTMLYVGCTGRVQIARELDFDHWKDYEGGEELYRYLQNYSRNLPAVIEVAQ